MHNPTRQCRTFCKPSSCEARKNLTLCIRFFLQNPKCCVLNGLKLFPIHTTFHSLRFAILALTSSLVTFFAPNPRHFGALWSCPRKPCSFGVSSSKRLKFGAFPAHKLLSYDNCFRPTLVFLLFSRSLYKFTWPHTDVEPFQAAPQYARRKPGAGNPKNLPFVCPL